MTGHVGDRLGSFLSNLYYFAPTHPHAHTHIYIYIHICGSLFSVLFLSSVTTAQIFTPLCSVLGGSHDWEGGLHADAINKIAHVHIYMYVYIYLFTHTSMLEHRLAHIHVPYMLAHCLYGARSRSNCVCVLGYEVKVFAASLRHG